MSLRSFNSQRHIFGAKRDEGPKSPTPNRTGRRLITGAALNAQNCRLIFVGDDGAQISYPCRITDVANGGFCVTLLCAEVPQALAGGLAVLEQTDKSQAAVELRWINFPKLGVKRLPSERPG